MALKRHGERSHPNGDLGGKVSGIEPHHVERARLNEAFTHAIRILDKSRSVRILHHDDPDGLFASLGIRYFMGIRAPDARVASQAQPILDAGRIDPQKDTTYVIADLASNDHDKIKGRFEGSGAKLVFIDHHGRSEIGIGDNMSFINVPQMGPEKTTATSLVDELNILAGIVDPRPKRMATDLAAMTDGMIEGVPLAVASLQYGFEKLADFNKFSRFITRCANGQMEKLISKPKLWRNGLPDDFRSGEYKMIPAMVYQGLVMGDELSHTAFLEVPEPIEYDSMAEGIVKSAKGKKGAMIVFNERLSDADDGILASTLRLQVSDLDFISVSQPRKDGRGYTMKVRSMDREPLEPLIADRKLLDAGRNRYVTVNWHEPVTGADLEALAKRNGDMLVAKSDGENSHLLQPFMNMDVARALRRS